MTGAIETGADTGTESNQATNKHSVTYSIARSLITPYWLYTILPVSFITLGMVLASIEHGWDWQLWGLAVALMWFFDQGFKSVDLAADDIAIRHHSKIQFGLGVVQVVLAVVIGVWLALQTTVWILAFFAAIVFLGFAYDLEWFDGLLHDRTNVTGWGNLSVVIGWIPTMLGYVLLAEQFSVGIAVFAVGPMLLLGAVLWPEQDVKAEIYRTVGIEYTRDVARNDERLRARFLYSQLLVTFGVAAMAVGAMIEFVL